MWAMAKTHLLDSPDVRAKIMALGVSAQAYHNWKSRGAIPIAKCVQIEQLTGGEITRQQLRPKDWHAIWPELADKAEAA